MLLVRRLVFYALLMALLTFLWVVIMRLPGLGGVGRGRRG